MRHLLLLCLLAPPALFSQWDGSSRGITVHINFESSVLLGPLHYYAEISSATATMPGRRVPIDDGAIDIEDISPGMNTLRICDRNGATVLVQPFQADRGQGPLHVLIPPQTASAQPPSGTVSLYRLEHPLTRKTLREMQAAVKYLGQNDDAHAIEHLGKALALEPHIPEAHMWQGALYLRHGDLARADAEMQTAVQQGLRDPALYVNLGVLQVLRHDAASAVRYAEQALRLQPENPQAKQLLQRLRAKPS